MVLEEAIKKYRNEVVPPNVPCMTLEDFHKFALREAKLTEIKVSSVLMHLDSVGEVGRSDDRFLLISVRV